MTDDALDQIAFSPPEITDDDVEAVSRILRTGWLSTGSECAQLEAELSERTGAPHVVAMASCTAALEIALRQLRLQPGDRVGVPTWTFVSSVSSIVRAGGTPVLLDVDPDTLNVSPEAVEAAIADGLAALLVVHFGGVAVDRAVLDLAAAAGVPVLEDAAHALGATDHRGQVSGLGTLGACYSFYATKNLTSAEGGALATHDDEVAAFARSQRLHGLSSDAWGRYRVGANPDYDVLEPGMKANLPDVLAGLARSQLVRFDDMQARRRAVVERYRAALAAVEGLRCVPEQLAPGSADHLFVVVLPDGVDRSTVAKHLAEAGIGTSIHFRPVHTFTWFARHALVGPTGLGAADALRWRTLGLPLHAALRPDQVDRVVGALVGALS